MATLAAQRGFSSGIMSDLGWDEGIQVPVANEENKALEQELMKLQNELQTNTSTSEMLDDRISNMKDHMKNVEQELKQNLALIEAHGKEISSEEHMFMIAEREDGRLKQEKLKVLKKMEQTHEIRNNLENRVFGLNQQLEDVKKQVSWDQQALEAWLGRICKKR